MPDQITNIIHTLPEWRQSQGNNIEAIVEVFPEQALLDLALQLSVCGRNDPNIGFDRRPSSDGCVLAFLENAQQSRLSFHRHIADLIEKQRAALSLLKTAREPCLCSSERTLFVAEQLTFDELTRDSCHVDRHKRT